jgi:hypothetical protein
MASIAWSFDTSNMSHIKDKATLAIDREEQLPSRCLQGNYISLHALGRANEAHNTCWP